MITIKPLTYSTHILQLVLAVIILGLSIRTLLNSKSLNSVSKAFSNFIKNNHGTELSLSNNWKVNASSIASSAFTLLSSIINYFFPTVAINYFYPHNAITFEAYNQKTTKYLEVPTENFAKTSIFGLSKVATSYITSLLGSEGISNIFWFVNTIISVSNFAKTDCNSVSSLLKAYNVTGVSTTTSLINFFNIFDNSSTTTDMFEDIYTALSNANITFDDSAGITFSNLNGSNLQSNLLMKMSSDCNIKKASMSITIIMWILHIFSSGLVATELVQLYTKIRNLQVQVEKETNSDDISEDNSALDTQNKHTAEEINKENSGLDSKIFLVFKHRWGLFNPVLSRVSEKKPKN